MARKQVLTVTVNGTTAEELVPPRLLLCDFIRDNLALTGTHVACSVGTCGSCTVLLDGQPVRSCLMFALQANGAQITTVEALGTEQQLHPVQQAFHEHHGLQCGFCTPGILLSVAALLERNPDPGDDLIMATLEGHLCRCTGYLNIVRAVRGAVKLMAERRNSVATAAPPPAAP